MKQLFVTPVDMSISGNAGDTLQVHTREYNSVEVLDTKDCTDDVAVWNGILEAMKSWGGSYYTNAIVTVLFDGCFERSRIYSKTEVERALAGAQVARR